MTKIFTLLTVAALALISCAGLRQECEALKARTDRVAALAEGNLRRDLTTQEVRDLLGDPDDLITYRGVGSPQTWRYFIYPDCVKHLGLRAANTELVFVGGRLQRWAIFAGEIPNPPEAKWEY